MMIDLRVWRDQAEFSRMLRPDEAQIEDEERLERTKDHALHMISEITEMLDACGTWQTHRKKYTRIRNEENIRRQLIDQFKYWMTLCQLWGFSPSMMEETYWRKSATVRQRFAEEFLIQLNRPAVILDLDNVLCDYTKGFTDWAIYQIHQRTMKLRNPDGSDIPPHDMIRRIEDMRTRRCFFSAENAGVDLYDWMQLQHRFRTQGGFAQLPPMPHLAKFMKWLEYKKYAVIGLTSRAIESYGNVIDDTLFWLEKNEVRMDCVWWGPHKGEKLKDSFPNMNLIEFVVDDDPRYLAQYVALGIKRIYWMKEGMEGQAEPHASIVPVSSLADIVAIEKERTYGPQR